MGFTGNERSQDPRTSSSIDIPQNLLHPIDIAKSPPPYRSVKSIQDNGFWFYLFDRVFIGDKLQAMLGVRGSSTRAWHHHSLQGEQRQSGALADI